MKNAPVEDFNSFSKIVVFIRILTKSDSSTQQQLIQAHSDIMSHPLKTQLLFEEKIDFVFATGVIFIHSIFHPSC